MEEDPSGPSADPLAPVEPGSSEKDQDVSQALKEAVPSTVGEEEPGLDWEATTPAAWDHGGPGGATQQGASPSPDSGQPGQRASKDLRAPRRRPSSAKQIPCSSPACCLSFPSVRELAQHLRTHCPPTQSLEGKLFRCSALSCTETFPTMQELVAHGRLHYKPNRYFKCENCLLRFRTHRSLFKHLHVCAEHAHSPAPPPPALDREPPPPERPPEAEPPAPGPPFPLLEPLGAPAPAPAPAGPLLPCLHPAPLGPGPPRLRSCLAAAPGPPASSAAVWKKSQGASGSPRRPQGGSDAPAGHAAPGRIVWEHTRGRYSCMQCAFATASRAAMTQHLEEHRPGAPAADQQRPEPPAPGPPGPAPLDPAAPVPPSSEGDRPVFSPL